MGFPQLSLALRTPQPSREPLAPLTLGLCHLSPVQHKAVLCSVLPSSPVFCLFMFPCHPSLAQQEGRTQERQIAQKECWLERLCMCAHMHSPSPFSLPAVWRMGSWLSLHLRILTYPCFPGSRDRPLFSPANPRDSLVLRDLHL